MKTLIVNQAEVTRLLSMNECIGVVRDALIELATGNAQNPLRPVMWLPDRKGALGMMPGSLPSSGVMGLKVISIFPGNHGTPYDSHQGMVALFDTEHGCLMAMADATAITAIRTAAVSAVATDLLAGKNECELAILGSGVQATTHIEAMLAVRKVHRVRVWSRNPENAAGFARRAAARWRTEVEAVRSAREAVDGAGLVCTTTSSSEPVLRGEWLAPGTHINAVGACTPATRELDSVAIARAALFVDSRESAVNEAGDWLIAKREMALGDDHIRGEIGELLAGKVGGRASADEITIFKSLGLAVEDLASALHVYRKAVEEKAGTWIELGGERSGDS
jgi:ornithine cyclodeaminase/alanine dehydrogenase-like protein (mu-crystallin family)